MNRPSAQAHESEARWCAFCGYALPATPIRDTSGRQYCSRHCRQALEAGAESFAGRLGYKEFSTGVSVLDTLLPQGIPANAVILLTGQGGIRHRGLQTELLWRTLQRGEPAIAITFVDPPIAIVEHFFSFGWNVLPHLESGQLHIIDCFTSRLREEHRSPEHQTDWNEFLQGVLDETVSLVRDAGNFRAVEDVLHERLTAQEMMASGLVVVDSLDEAETQGNEFETKQFIKEVRGDICSRRFVPIFAGTTADETGTGDDSYLFDGIVTMRRNDSLVDGVWLKQLSIQKMDGVLYRPHWIAYENAGQRGFQPFDPQTEFDAVYGTHPVQSHHPEVSQRPGR